MKRSAEHDAGSSKKSCSDEAQAEEENNGLSIHDLPDEMLIKIFKYLTPEQLVASPGPVCQLWNQLVYKEVLGRTLSFCGFAIRTPQLLTFLRDAPGLISLELAERNDLTEVLTEVAQHNRKLQRLCIRECYGSPSEEHIPIAIFLQLIRSCRGITELTIKCSSFSSPLKTTVLTAALPKLRKINFQDMELAALDLAELARGCQNLEEIRLDPDLYVSYTGISENIVEMAKYLHGSLKVFSITCCVTEACAAALASCQQLEELQLISGTTNKLTDTGLMRLGALKKLTSLNLTNGREVTDLGWQRFFSRAACVGQLRILCLMHCTFVDDSVVSTIAQFHPGLEEVNFSYCLGVSDDGISDIIRGCRKLRVLKLEWNQSFVARSFKLIPEYTPGLKSLWFCAPIKDVVDWTALKKQLPNLEIHKV